jgi:hypothetical protein
MTGVGRKQTEKAVNLSLQKGPLTSAKQTFSHMGQEVCFVPKEDIGVLQVATSE